MKRFIKIKAAASILCISVLLQLTVGAAAFLYSDKYSTVQTETIGWPGYPVQISAGGAFTDANGDGVGFGAPKYAALSRDSSGYPVLTHTYKLGAVSYTLTQFVYKPVIGAKSCICVYSQLSAENPSDETSPFTAPDTRHCPLTEVPSEVPADGSAQCSFVTAVQNSDKVTAEELISAGTYSECELKMKEMWDSYTEKGCFSSGEALPEGMYESYRAETISSAVNGKMSPLSAYEGRDETIADGTDPFTVYLYTLKHGIGEYSGIESAADALVENIHTFTSDESGKEIRLFGAGSDGALPPVEDCFEAIVQLTACTEIAPLCGVSEDKINEYKESLDKLLKGTETVFTNSVQASEYSWEVTESAADSSKLQAALDPESTPEALCSWYIRCAAMGRFDSEKLCALAREALCDLTVFGDPALNALASLQLSSNGGIYIGRGLSPDLLLNGSINIRTADKNGETVQANISAEGDTVTVSVTAPQASPVTIALPFLKGAIKEASCAYKEDSGIVTPTPGSSSVQIRLSSSLSDINERYRAHKAIEAALYRASLADTGGCTSISLREFEAALKNALGARGADISSGEVMQDAETLEKSCLALSKMTSSYELMPDGSETAKSIPVGADGLIQRLVLPKDGTLTALYLDAEGSGKMTAAVYTADGDGYTPKAELAVSEGTAEEDGRIKFTFDTDIEGDAVYAVKFTAEASGGEVLVRTVQTDGTEDLYRTVSENTEIYPNISAAVSARIVQADRSELDAFYEKCRNTDVSEYTRESVKKLHSAMQSASELLRTPDAEKDDCDTALEQMQQAYSGLSTYASDKKAGPPSPVLYALIGATVVLLCAALVSASSSGKNKKNNRRSNT